MSGFSGIIVNKGKVRSGILNGLIWTYLSLVVQGAVKIGVIVILARVLGPREFGLLGYALMCTSFLERVAQLAVGPALVQRREVDGDVVRTAQILSVLSGVLSALAIYAGSGYVADFFSEPELKPILQFLSLGCAVEALTVIPDSLLQRELRFREIMLAETISYLVSMALIATVLAYFQYGVWALVIATLSLKVIRCCVLTWFRPQVSAGLWRMEHARELIRLSFGFSLGRLFNFFSLQGDNFIVGRVLGVEALGMYTRAYQLMTLPAMYVGQILERVMFPAMARTQDSPETLRNHFLLSLEAITLIALPSGVLMYFLSREIVLAGFGVSWEPVIPVLSVLSFGVFFRTAYKCSDTLVRSQGAVYNYALRQGFYTALVIGGAWCGAVARGLEGVAIGVVAAIAINYLSMTVLSRAILRLSWKEIVRVHMPGVIISIWCGVGSYAAREWLYAVTSLSWCVLLGAGLSGVIAGITGTFLMRNLVPSQVVRSVCRLRAKRALVPSIVEPLMVEK